MPDTDTPTAWIDVCALDDVKTGEGLYDEHTDWDLAVLRPDEDEIFVMHNRCPHAGGSLASGWMDEGCVVCPWHSWAFDLNSGECPEAPQFRVRTFPARVVDGRVEAQIAPPEDR